MTESGDLLTADNQTTSTEQGSWKDGIDKEIRFNKEGSDRLARFDDKDTAGIVKSYLDMETQSGGKVKIPNEESTPEERSAFYNKLGRPGQPQDYEVDKPDMPEGMDYDEKFEMTMRGIAHESGVTKDQFKALVKAYNDYQMEIFSDGADDLQLFQDMKGLIKTEEETKTELQTKWLGDDYAKNMEISRRALRELVPGELGEQFVDLINKSKLGNNPIMIQAFKEIGSKMLDDTFVKGEQVVTDKTYIPSFPNSPEQYRNGEDEESKKARAWFVAKGHIY